MRLFKYTALISLLFMLSNHQTKASFNGTIMFDLDQAVDVTFLQKAYKVLGNETGFSLVPGREMIFLNLPHLPYSSKADVLWQEISKMQDVNTMLLIGRRTYMGMKLTKSKIATRVANYFMNYLPVFTFPIGLTAKIIAKVYRHLHKFDNNIPVRTMFVLNITADNPERPWENFQILSILLQDIDSNLRLVYYKNNAVDIARTIRDNQVSDIVLMVNTEATEAILTAAQTRSLLNWHYRWIIFLQSTSYVDITKVGFNQISQNITVIQFADAAGNPNLKMSNSMTCLCHDALKIGLSVLQVVLSDTLNGTATIEGITGNFSLDYSKLNSTFPDEVCTRDSWIMHVYHGLGSDATLVGNITGLPNGDSIILSALPDPKFNVISEATVMKQLRLNPFRIITVIEKPFVQYKENSSGLIDLKDKLEGFVIDITKALMESLNISYVIELDPSGKYGAKQPNGSWNGMILKIMNQRADFAAGAFSITEDRKQVVDFLDSYLEFRGAVLLKQTNDTGFAAIFQFLYPFHYNVWIMLLGSMLVIAIVLTVLNLIFPNKMNFTFFESSYYVTGTMFQGVGTSPPDRSSGRIVMCFWWFFTLIVIIAYVSNYTAYRTQKRLQGNILALENLLTQHHFSYGTVRDTAFDTLFSTSTFEYMQKLNKMIRHENPNGLVANAEVALKLVREGKYAFIWDNIITRYYAYEECLRSTAEFENFQYGFIVTKNADFKDVLNHHLRMLKKSGKIAAILERYPYISGRTENPKCKYVGFIGMVRKFMPKIYFKYESEHAIDFEHFLGIFFLIAGGCVLSLIFSVIECMTNFWCRRRAKHKREEQERLNLYNYNLNTHSKA